MQTIRAILTGVAAVAPISGCKPADPTVQVTPISVISERPGVGREAKTDDLVTISYRIVTDEGREVLSEDGYRFIVGTGSVIEGIDDAVKGMRASGERVISCPPHRHWGRGGYGDNQVPANATLTIYLELESIE